MKEKIQKLIESLELYADRFEKGDIASFGGGVAYDPVCPPCMFGAALLNAGWKPPHEVSENITALSLYLYGGDVYLFQVPGRIEGLLAEVSFHNDTCDWENKEERDLLLHSARATVDALREWEEELS